jgi:fructokinase
MTTSGSALVIGEALIDIVETSGGASEHVGGSPANVALGLGRRGVDVTLLTQFGADPRGAAIESHLSASRVRTLVERGEATSTARARIQSDGSAEYVFDIRWGVFGEPDLPAASLVHTGSIAAFLEPGAGDVVRLLRETSAPEVTFDPNIRPDLVGERESVVARFHEIARLSTVVKMSDEDAEWLFSGLAPDEVLDLVLADGVRLAALTLGAEGAILASSEHRVRVAPVRVEAVDTIGAGDTFMASLIASVLATGSAGLDREAIDEIGRDAVHSAAITVSRAGADLPWAHELAAA